MECERYLGVAESDSKAKLDVAGPFLLHQFVTVTDKAVWSMAH